MPPRDSLTNIQLRKQLLITEAEVHREQMWQDFHVVARGVEGLARKAKSFGAVASVASLMVGGFTALRGVRQSSHIGQASLFSRLFSGLRLASTLWRGWNSIKHSRSTTSQDWSGRAD